VTGWTNPTNVYADDTSYASVTSTTRNGNYSSDFGTFGFDGLIPTGSTINSVTIEVAWYLSVKTVASTLGAQAIVSGAVFGTELTDAATPTGAPVVRSAIIPGLTRAQLLDGVFAVRARYTRPNSATSQTAYLDYV
jgi:hypothetical protein